MTSVEKVDILGFHIHAFLGRIWLVLGFLFFLFFFLAYFNFNLYLVLELKKRVDKYFDGDDEAIPSIFEAILERKLAKLQGKHDEKDEELIEKICGKREVLHSDSDPRDNDCIESDSDEFSDYSESD